MIEEITNIYLNPKWFNILAQRNELLKESDWTQLPDVELTPEEIEAIRIYRQQLRDITKVYQNPEDVVFPEKPFDF